MTDQARVWVLVGERTGDKNQLFRLADELGLPFRTIGLDYNALHLLPPRFLGATLATLDEASRARIGPPWPDLVLGIGFRSVPVALAIRELSGGKAKLVRLGNPRLDPENFDLVITTPQYAVRSAPNVLRLPLGINTAPRLEPTREEEEWLAKLPRPHRLLLIGGDTFMWALRPKALSNAASNLAAKGGSVIAVSSARTSKAMEEAVAQALNGKQHGFVKGRFPRYPILLQDADEIHVTADSAAMTSDAVASGKPVGLLLPDKSATGQLFYRLAETGLRVPVRDIRRFWTGVLEKGLAGSLDEPRSAKLGCDPLGEAAAAVRALLAR
ncbi:MAG TPA: ELM1/GtrOC1 family putative glycosyltransferase [Sphingomicrobium sp.]|nr:ELM1/GtrOC1 family putative glycosyltransferase [Sphingomicrobium sp.]